MMNFAQIGNQLYTGERSVDFVGRRKTWYIVSAVLIALALGGLLGRGLNFGIEFTGGSEFRVSSVANTSGYEDKARTAVSDAGIGGNVTATVIGGNSVRIQTEEASDRTDEARTAIAGAFGVGEDRVSASQIGPSWGESVSQQAIRGLVVFLVLVTIFLAVYFRTWKMALSALVALLHDLVITIGIYALFGFEVTPSSMIGFLTILGYSLYDTVVVFDKVRENTAEARTTKRMTYAEAANLAVNQTLVRSINTTVVALLPIAAILFVGFTMLGPGTLLDLSLALFIGIAVGAYSSIFIATPMLVHLRRGEEDVKAHDAAVLRRREKHSTQPGGAVADGTVAGSHGITTAADDPDRPDGSAPVTAGAVGARGAAGTAATAGPGGPVVGASSGGSTRVPRGSDGGAAPAPGRQVHKWAESGPRNQPKRQPKSKR